MTYNTKECRMMQFVCRKSLSRIADELRYNSQDKGSMMLKIKSKIVFSYTIVSVYENCIILIYNLLNMETICCNAQREMMKKARKARMGKQTLCLVLLLSTSALYISIH